MLKNLGNNVFYIGCDDTDIDLFESQYTVPEGVSYNSYLILDEKIAVLDTCDGRKGDEWKARLEEALGGRQPDYLWFTTWNRITPPWPHGRWSASPALPL